MSKPQLIFVTKENEAALKQLAPEGLGKTVCPHEVPAEEWCPLCKNMKEPDHAAKNDST